MLQTIEAACANQKSLILSQYHNPAGPTPGKITFSHCNRTADLASGNLALSHSSSPLRSPSTILTSSQCFKGCRLAAEISLFLNVYRFLASPESFSLFLNVLRPVAWLPKFSLFLNVYRFVASSEDFSLFLNVLMPICLAAEALTLSQCLAVARATRGCNLSTFSLQLSLETCNFQLQPSCNHPRI